MPSTDIYSYIEHDNCEAVLYTGMIKIRNMGGIITQRYLGCPLLVVPQAAAVHGSFVVDTSTICALATLQD